MFCGFSKACILLHECNDDDESCITLVLALKFLMFRVEIADEYRMEWSMDV